MYRKLETVFHHISKHLEFCQQYSAVRRIFNSLLSVWKCDETLSLVFDILLKTFKLFWRGGYKAQIGVGVVIAGWMIMYQNLYRNLKDIGMELWSWILLWLWRFWKWYSCYATHVGGVNSEKEDFFELMDRDVLIGGYFIVHLGRFCGGYGNCRSEGTRMMGMAGEKGVQAC